MRVISFGSGSSGNAFLIQSAGVNVLLDAGVGVRRLVAGLAAAGAGLEDLDAVLVSHEHHDHVRALPQMLARTQARTPLLATPGTIKALAGYCDGDWTAIRPDSTARVRSLDVTALAVSHDASDPVGFLLDDGECRVAIFTDLGDVSSTLIEPIQTADLVVLEANYDELMLERGPYPPHLKRRIRGAKGHLSNDACADLLARALSSRATDVWLAHLSENNNRPGTAVATVRERLGTGTAIPRVRSLPRRGRDVIWDSAVAFGPRQLALPLR